MLPIPPASFGPTPQLPAEETAAPSAATPDAPGEATSSDGATLLTVLKHAFAPHPDLQAIADPEGSANPTRGAPATADPTRTAQARREYDQASALFDAGRYADALEHYEKAQAIVPAADNLYSQGACLERLGRHEEAAKKYEAYAAAAPHADDAGGAKTRAADLHAKARSLAHDAYERGNAALDRGQFAQAAAAFREARDHLPSPAATYMLAQSLDRAGASVATVVGEYQRYLNEAPGADDAGKVRDRIHALLDATGNGLMQPQ